MLAAILSVGVCAYWLLPRLIDDWTRAEAARYLRRITSARVRVAEAKFSLFGGIELRGVSIEAPNSPGRERFFYAETVVLRHRPWSLFTDRRLTPTEIVCIGPEVASEYDDQRGRYVWEDIVEAIGQYYRSPAVGRSKGALPVISFRDVHVRMLTGETWLNISMIPSPGVYRLMLEERRRGREPLRGTWRIDLQSGNVLLEEGAIPKIAQTDGILPQRYAKWRKWYNIEGKVVLKGGSAGADGSEATLEAKLEDVSLRLQPDEGGLELVGVRGTLAFAKDGVSVEGLTGRVPRAGDAGFRMSGRYDGYDANSPFDLHVSVQGMSLPDGSGATGWLAKTLAFLNTAFRPIGDLDLSADFKRLADGRIEVKGAAAPQGMSFVYNRFPYRIEGVTGTIGFDANASGDRVFLTDVVGRRGEAVMRIDGRIDLRDRGRYDVTVQADGAPLDDEMRQALPEKYRSVWDSFDPAGRTDATVRVWREGSGQMQNVDVELSADGGASAAYKPFPYRLEELTGRVRISREAVTIDSLRGRRGPMRCTIDGSLAGIGGVGGETNLTIEATEVPLDDHLIASLPERTRPTAESLHASGLADRVSATILQSKGQPLDFRVVARIKEGQFRPKAFPYPITDANGVLTFRPGRVIVEDLAGRHGQTPVTVSGQVLMDSNASAVDLHVGAKGAVLDDELYQALPKGVQDVWRKLSAGGRADVDLTLQHGMAEASRELDYRLVLDANAMTVRYEDFPYKLTGVVGRAVATPVGVTLEDMIARHGPALLRVSGTMKLDGQSESARLSLRGTNVPIDDELLAALPRTLAPLAKRVRPGGSCGFDMKDFRIERRARPSPASRPATQPTTAPAGPSDVRWSMDGQVSFRGATMDLGLGHKTLTGSLTGAAAQQGGSLAVDARIALDSVLVARQKLTDLRGRVTKDARGQMLRVRELSAKAHGGRVAGFAEIRLTDPLECGVSLSVEGIRLGELFGTAAGGAKPKEVQGLLAGSVQLTVVTGDNPSRQASGVLKITKGKLYKLPVMLGLLHVLYLSLPGDTAFTDGQLTYHLRDDVLIFNEIYLRGPVMSIVGSGTMNMKTKALDLKFLTGPPRKLPRLGGLGELLEGIAREVAEIHVGGTLQKPKMRTVPLRNLDKLLRDLLNPGHGT